MNILYLHAHDVGRASSVYGTNVPTPNLQNFASSGATIFTNAHAVAPTCSPSRAALLTGQYPHQQGMLGLAHLGHTLKCPQRHIAHWLGEEGYARALIGVQHEFSKEDAAALPYDTVLDGEWGDGIRGYDSSIADLASEWLDSYDRQKPFFLSVGLFWPHVPLPEVNVPAIRNAIAPWPDVEEGCLDTAAFSLAMEHTDQCMGRVLDALERSAFAENTLVLITTDHGVPFPSNKATLTDRGTGVLFILRVPGQKGVEESNALVSHLDFFPTVCELANLEKPDWLEGESLLSVLGGKDTHREALLTTTNHHVDYEPSRSIRTRSHRLIYRCIEGTRSASNVDATRLKEFAWKNGYFDQDAAQFELYDLVNDREELKNIAFREKHRELVASLCSKLQNLMEDAGDPLINVSRGKAISFS